MPDFEVGDVVVVTGPLSIEGGVGSVHLTPGEVGSVVQVDSGWRGARVDGRDSGRTQWIDASSLTLFSDIAEDPTVQWGELEKIEIAPNPLFPAPALQYDDLGRYVDIHDYVWEGE